MRCKIALVGGIACFIMATAAFSEPDWVKKAAVDAKGVIAPDEATAIVLLHTTDIKISKSGKADAETRLAFKILTRAGLDHARLSHPVYPFLKIKKLDCWVVKPRGQVRSLDKDDFVTFGFLGSAGYYDDSRVMRAAPPHVEPGDVVAFEIKTQEDGWTRFYQSFVFQVQQPVRLARFSLTVPKGWQVIYGAWRAEDVEFEHEENRYIWTARGLAYQPDEPLAPSWYFLSRRLTAACYDPGGAAEKDLAAQFADWQAVAQWVIDVYREPCWPTAEIQVEVDRIVDAGMGFEEKVRAMAEFAQNEIRYVAVEIGKNRWEPRPAATTLLNRYGDCKDKSVLMVAMLETAGIRAAPVLCNSHYPVDPRVPSPFAFNHCIVAIPLEDTSEVADFEDAVVGGWLFFDPTDPATCLGQVPWSLQGNRVLVGAETDSVLVKLPYPEPEDFRRIYRARARLREDGSIRADVVVIDFGGAAAYMKYACRTSPRKDFINHWTNRLSETAPSVTVSGFSTGAAGDSAWASFTMESGRYVQEAGGLMFLRPDIFRSSEVPVLTAEERRFPVWFGPPQESTTDITWELPAGWTAEVETPEAERECEAASMTCRTGIEGGTLRTRMVYRRNGRLIWPEDYDSAKDFSRGLNQINGQVVMIRRP